jgi:DNA polymerase III, delta subunit
MIYVLFGLEKYLIDKKIKEIIKENNISEHSISNYNLENTLLGDIIDDVNMPDMFSEKKLVLVDNTYIFTGTNIKTAPEHNLDTLIKYLDNKNNETILIFKVNNEKLDVRKKIVKLIKEKTITLEFNKVLNINDFAKENFENYKIEYSTISYLITRVGYDLNNLANEIEKLKLYKFEDKKITKEDIDNLTIKNIDLNIFTFIDDIIAKRKEKAYETYKEIIKMGEEPIAINVMLANQFRIMLKSKELQMRGYSEKAIADCLDIHPFRVKKALEKTNLYSNEILEEHLNSLCENDINIKTGKIDKYLALEIFILSL